MRGGRGCLSAVAVGTFLVTLTACGSRGGSESRCGDGVRDAGEACDGALLGGKSCESEGFVQGVLTCTAGCTLDTSGCIATLDRRDAVIYHVLVDRFLDGDSNNNGSVAGAEAAADYQGGDWAGVLQKIQDGYFQDLGVTALWVSSPAENANESALGDDGHSYAAYQGEWPTALDQTESHYGAAAELTALVTAAHARGIQVFLTYVMNHVHVSAPVYAQHPEWFWPLQDGARYCLCGADCSWDGTDGERCWLRDYLPDFNFTIQEARDFSVNDAIQWIQNTGVDGLFVDSPNRVDPSWIQALRARVTSDVEPVRGKHVYLMGDTFSGDPATIAGLVDETTMLDGQEDFPLRAVLVAAVLLRTSSLADLDTFLAANAAAYGGGVMSTSLGGRKVPRAVHFAEDTPLWTDPWADGKDRAWSNTPTAAGSLAAYERLATAYAVLFTIPGAPLLFYGEEIGLPGGGVPDTHRQMRWASYAPGQSFLRERLGRLAAIRAGHWAIRRGARTTLGVTSDTLVYRMAAPGDEVFVAINRSDASQEVSGLPGVLLRDALDDTTHQGPTLSLPARSARILVP